MALAKWILGGLGWAAGGPIGAIIGFVVGSVIEKTPKKETGQQGSARKTYSTSESDFIVSLLALTAATMKADNKVQKVELDYVKDFFVRQFGVEKAKDLLLALRDILQKEYSVRNVCLQIRQNTSYQTRLELLHYLFGLSLCDGYLHDKERLLLQSISSYLGVSEKDYNTIKEIFIPEQIRNPYAILQVDENATDEEIKKAYRRLATKHHPDKVSHLGEEIRKDAEVKFQEINNAYQTIKRVRGIK